MTLYKYSDYKDSGVKWLSDVPEHWDVRKNKHAFRVVSTLVGSKSKDFQLLSLTLRGVIPRDIESGKGKFPAEFDTYQTVEPDDIVFCLFDIDETPRTVGISSDFGMITGAYTVVRVFAGADPRFIYYYYFSVDLRKGLRPFYTGLRKVVRPETFMNIELPLPPLSEQANICDFLDHETARIDALIEEQQRLIELLKEKRQAVISHAVTKGLDPKVPMKYSGVEWLGEVPAHWDLKALRYLGECQNGINIGGEAFGSGSPFVSYGDVYKNDVLPAEVTGLVQSSPEDRQRYSIEYGDVLFTRTSETVDEIGFSATCLQKLQDAVFAGFLIRFRPTGNSITPDFSKYYFRNQMLRSFFNKEMNLVTRASLSQDLLKQLPVTLPPITEQIKISDFLDKVTAEFASLLEQGRWSIDLLTERRSALISAAVTGKIDVRGWQPSARVPFPELEQEAV